MHEGCFQATEIVEQARSTNPTLEIIARAHFYAEVEYLDGLDANSVIIGEREIACSIVDLVIPAKSPAPPTSS